MTTFARPAANRSDRSCHAAWNGDMATPLPVFSPFRIARTPSSPLPCPVYVTRQIRRSLLARVVRVVAKLDRPRRPPEGRESYSRDRSLGRRIVQETVFRIRHGFDAPNSERASLDRLVTPLAVSLDSQECFMSADGCVQSRVWEPVTLILSNIQSNQIVLLTAQWKKSMPLMG